MTSLVKSNSQANMSASNIEKTSIDKDKHRMTWNHAMIHKFTSIMYNGGFYKKNGKGKKVDKWKKVRDCLKESPLFSHVNLDKVSDEALRSKWSQTLSAFEKKGSFSNEGNNISGLAPMSEADQLIHDMLKEIKETEDESE